MTASPTIFGLEDSTILGLTPARLTPILSEEVNMISLGVPGVRFLVAERLSQSRTSCALSAGHCCRPVNDRDKASVSLNQRKTLAANICDNSHQSQTYGTCNICWHSVSDTVCDPQDPWCLTLTFGNRCTFEKSMQLYPAKTCRARLEINSVLAVGG